MEKNQKNQKSLQNTSRCSPGSLVNILNQDGEIIGLGLFIDTQRDNNSFWQYRVLIDGKIKLYNPVYYSMLTAQIQKAT